jgi:acetylornithine deacetylase/succinyl-diaminopimelate desuccinylase-like protein
MSTDHALSVLAQDEKPAVARLIDWLKIPSISTDPAYRTQTRHAAEWIAEQLRQCGLAVEISETGSIGPDGRGAGHPIVLATTHGTPDQWRQHPDDPRHVLFYGHYDVQPADPLELWESPPFEPVIKPASGEIGERIVARGAVDDKGQVMMFIEALRAWKAATGKVAGGARFTVLLEGEEESGSVNLEAWVKARTEMLSRCKVCLISDTGMLGRERPAITYGVRGLSYTEVVLHGPNQDLHSGLWGGRSPNPINELTKVLGRLWDADRRVTLPGFYSDVRPLTEGERENWRKLGVDAHAALAKIGLPPEADIGEKGYTSTEREWARPTAEINGIVGGYTGKGAKTVIPAFASAKVSFRLVADQDPGKVTRSFFDWCKANTPPGCRWEFIDHSGGFPATVQTDSPFLAAASRAVEKAAGKKPELIKSGGSIPVAGMLKGLCGLETVFMGFGLDDDRVHSPNEKFELACYRMGARSHTALIGELLSMKG